MYNVNLERDQNYSYGICSMLAYKEISSFNYTSFESNIPNEYKHAVVSTSLHRIHKRNSRQIDVDHHLSFMWKLLGHRHQNPSDVRRRFRNYFKNKHNAVSKKKTTCKASSFVALTFDRVYIWQNCCTSHLDPR